jgi:hypothetical protein
LISHAIEIVARASKKLALVAWEERMLRTRREARASTVHTQWLSEPFSVTGRFHRRLDRLHEYVDSQISCYDISRPLTDQITLDAQRGYLARARPLYPMIADIPDVSGFFGSGPILLKKSSPPAGPIF